MLHHNVWVPVGHDIEHAIGIKNDPLEYIPNSNREPDVSSYLYPRFVRAHWWGGVWRLLVETIAQAFLKHEDHHLSLCTTSASNPDS